MVLMDMGYYTTIGQIEEGERGWKKALLIVNIKRTWDLGIDEHHRWLRSSKLGYRLTRTLRKGIGL